MNPLNFKLRKRNKTLSINYNNATLGGLFSPYSHTPNTLLPLRMARYMTYRRGWYGRAHMTTEGKLAELK